MAPLSLIPPGLIVAVLVVLILSQLSYAFLPFRRRGYLAVLVVTAIGIALGQVWDYVGLPSWRLGEANMLPAVVFALLLQPVARFAPRRQRQPKEPSGRPPAGTQPHA